MEIEERDARFVSEYEGRKFVFCSYSCQSEFEKDPQKFLITSEETLVKDLMTTDVKFVNGDSLIVEASKIMSEGNLGCVLVIESGSIIGILTESDLVKRVLAESFQASKVLAKDVMSSPVVSVEPESTIEDSAKIMSQYGIRKLPVVKDGALRGLLTADQIAMNLAREKDFSDHRLNAVARYCVSPAQVYS